MPFLRINFTYLFLKIESCFFITITNNIRFQNNATESEIEDYWILALFLMGFVFISYYIISLV